MTFLELNAVFLGAAGLAAGSAVALRRVPRGAGTALAVSIAVLWALTAVFDNVMIASGLFDYGGESLAGVRIGLAPIEDFAYPLGAALLLPALWLLLPGGGRDTPRGGGKTARGAYVGTARDGDGPPGPRRTADRPGDGGARPVRGQDRGQA